MQRHDRRNIYDLFYAKPAPPVRRKDCFEVDRAPARRRLGRDAARRGEGRAPTLIPALKAGGYRAVAICLLNAYANPAHEQRLAALITEALPGVLVTCSHQVAREFREFERASTTLLSAYVQPVIDGYLHRFESKLAECGLHGPLHGDADQRRAPAGRGDAHQRHHRALFRARPPAWSARRARRRARASRT